MTDYYVHGYLATKTGFCRSDSHALSFHSNDEPTCPKCRTYAAVDSAFFLQDPVLGFWGNAKAVTAYVNANMLERAFLREQIVAEAWGLA